MEINEFIQNVADQFNHTDASEIKPETVFKEMEEWSSLLALNVIAMVDEEYGVVLKGNDVIHAVTVEDLFNLVKSRR